MRVVQLRRGRVIKFSLLAVLCLLGLLVGFKKYSGQDWSEELNRLNNIKAEALGSAGKHQSYPGDKPKFLGSGNPGNFEPQSYGGGSGPGDNGQAHQLRVEQKTEEERLKGVYGFNQLVSDEISLDRTVPDTVRSLRHGVVDLILIFRGRRSVATGTTRPSFPPPASSSSSTTRAGPLSSEL